MRIAVTGGTGFIGRHLVNRLLLDGHFVSVIGRKSPSEGLVNQLVRFSTGSIDDADALRSVFENTQTVYHLVGIIAETKTNTFDRTVVQGTANVVKACQDAGVSKLIYLSAMGTSAEAPTNYHRTKYLAEQSVINSGLDYVIYRPSVVYGPGDGFVSLLTRMIKMSPVTPVIGSGRYELQPVFVDDLVQAMVGGLTVEQARSQIIEIGGPEKLEYLQILNIIKGVLRKRRMNFHLPMAVMKTVAAVMEKLLKPAPLTRDQLKMMEMGNTGDIRKMKEFFAVEPIDFENGLRKYLR